MNRKTLIALGVFAVLLVAVVITRSTSRTGLEFGFSLAPVMGEADTIEIARQDESVRLRLLDGDVERWRLESPMDFPANQQKVENLLEVYSEEIGMDLQFPVTDDELERYGLDPENAIDLTMRAGDRVLWEISVGRTVGNRTFIRRPGDAHVYRAAANLRWQVDRTLQDWREMKILDVERDSVSGIELEYPDERVHVSRAPGQSPQGDDPQEEVGDGRGRAWKIVAPEELEADSSSVSLLLGNLLNLRASAFADSLSPEDTTAFTSDSIRISLKRFQEPEVTVLVGKELGEDHPEGQLTDDRFVAIEGQEQVYIVRSHTIGNLLKRTADLRDKTMLSFTRDQVSSIWVEDGQGQIRVSFERDEDSEMGLVFPPAGRDNLDVTALNSFKSTLGNLKGTQVFDHLDPRSAGLRPRANTARVVVVTDDDRTMGLNVGAIARADVNEYYASVDNRPEIFTIREFVVNQILRDPEVYFAD